MKIKKFTLLNNFLCQFINDKLHMLSYLKNVSDNNRIMEDLIILQEDKDKKEIVYNVTQYLTLRNSRQEMINFFFNYS